MPKRPARTPAPPPTPDTRTTAVWPPVAPDTTPGAPFYFTEPTTDSPHYDNPLNPRGVPSHLTDGAADAQATDAQKTQNPTPQRQPVNATTYPDLTVNAERVSAGQNRKPPAEIIP